MNAEIWALAGFLGLPSDWNCFGFEKIRAFGSADFEWDSLAGWAKQLNLNFEMQGNRPSILMGYSLGARLALHALVQKPSLWQGAVIVSGHPGLVEESERLARQQMDNEWAQRFEREEWNDLMLSWNQRSVFSGDHFQFERDEKDYCRQRLADTLRCVSLGLQSNLRQELSMLNLPILWIVGERDEAYCKLMQEVELKHPLSRRVVLPHAGHRAPWERPAQFRMLVEEWRECRGK